MSRRQRTSAVVTAREWEVLALVAQGLSNKEIARELVIEESTVENHLHHIYRKLGVKSRAQAAVWAVRQGLLG